MLMNAQQAAQIIKSISDDRQQVVLDEICNVLDKRINNGKDYLWVPRKYMYPDFVKYFKELGYKVIYYPHEINFREFYHYEYSYYRKEYKHDKTAYLITVNNNKVNKLKKKINDEKSYFLLGSIAFLIGLMICCYYANGTLRTLSKVID